MALLAAQRPRRETRTPTSPRPRSRRPTRDRSTTSHRDGRSVDLGLGPRHRHHVGRRRVRAARRRAGRAASARRRSSPRSASSCGSGHRHGQSLAATATRIRCPGRNRQPVAIRSSSTVGLALAGEVDRAARHRLGFARGRDVVELDRHDRPRAGMARSRSRTRGAPSTATGSASGSVSKQALRASSTRWSPNSPLSGGGGHQLPVARPTAADAGAVLPARPASAPSPRPTPARPSLEIHSPETRGLAPPRWSRAPR